MKLVFNTALRYVFSKKAGQRTSSVLIVLSIAVGIAVMISAAGIMNGLQTEQLEAIRTVSSFDLKIENTTLTKEEIEKAVNGTCYEFKDYPCVLNSTDGSVSKTLMIREIEDDWFNDYRVNEQISCTVKEGNNQGVILSFPVYLSIPSGVRNKVTVTFLKKGTTAVISPHKLESAVKGIYSCSLYDFASNYAFASSGLFSETEHSGIFGVYTDISSTKAAKRILALDSGADVVTWQQDNNSVYSALILEKALMYLFLGCIFLIICIGLGNATKRLIEVRKREGAILNACGMEKSVLYCIFLLYGLIIVITGLVPGCVLGNLIIKFVPEFLMLEPVITFKEVLIICISVITLFVLYCSLICRKIFGKTVMEALEGVSN